MSKKTKSNTTLDLFKYDPTVDGDNTFNIDVALNDNWDKLEVKAQEVDSEIIGLKEQIKGVDVSWNGISGKPSTFPPSTHTHTDFTQDITLAHSGFPRVYVQRGTGQGIGCLEGGENNVNIEAINEVGDNKNRRLLILQNSKIQPDLSKCLRISDYVNGSSKNYFMYGDHNKGTFRQLADLGLTDSDFSSTDLGANMYKIVYASPKYCMISDYIKSSTHYNNLHTCISTKAKNELGITLNDCNIIIEIGNGTNLPNKVIIRPSGRYTEYVFFYDRDGTTELISKFTQTVGGGGVKSIQRGFFKGTVYGQGTYTVNISSINPSKAVVFLNGTTSLQSGDYNTDPYLVSVSATNFVFAFPGSSSLSASNVPVSWQVVEYN